MAARWFRGLVLTILLMGLSACSSTATQTTTVDSRSDTSQQLAGSVRIGTFFDSRYLGRWTMSDRFARSCTYQFLAEPMAGSTTIAKATPFGYCVAPFDTVAGWQSIGRSVVLFNAAGDRLVEASLDRPDTYRGRYRGTTLTTEVVLRRGFV